MRRSDKQITDEHEIHDVLVTNHICRIAMCDGKTPYLVPVDYGYDESCIYFHSAGAGRKIDVLAQNDNVCFEITDSISMVESEIACGFSTSYRSVIGFGTASILTEEAEKRRGLMTIMRQHTGRSPWEIPADRLNGVTVLKIDIDSVTGKTSGL